MARITRSATVARNDKRRSRGREEIRSRAGKGATTAMGRVKIPMGERELGTAVITSVESE